MNFLKFKNKKRENKEERKVMKEANNIVKESILQKALEENKEKELKIEILEANLRVLTTTIENIKKICNNSKGSIVSKKKILNEIGE